MIDVSQHLGLARKAASPYARVQNVEIEDTEEYAEALVALMRAAEQFDESVGTQFSTYAYRKIRGYLSHMRTDRSRRQPAASCSIDGESSFDLSGGDVVSDEVDCGERKTAVRLAVRRLPRPYRDVIQLWMDGLSMKEIAAKLGMKIPKVERLFNIALTVLRQGIPDELGEID